MGSSSSRQPGEAGRPGDLVRGWRRKIAATGGVTVTLSSGATIAFTVLDITGTTATPLDKTATAGGSGTAATTGTTATTAQSSEVAVAAIGWNSKLTATPSTGDAGYSTPTIEQSTGANVAGQMTASTVLTTAGAESYAATFSQSTSFTGAIATFAGRIRPASDTDTDGHDQPNRKWYADRNANANANTNANTHANTNTDVVTAR